MKRLEYDVVTSDQAAAIIITHCVVSVVKQYECMTHANTGVREKNVFSKLRNPTSGNDLLLIQHVFHVMHLAKKAANLTIENKYTNT